MVSVGLVLPALVNAVGLGSLNVLSALNQPLNAYIELTLDKGTLLEGVKVRLAMPDAFQKAGLERPYRLSQLVFKVTRLNDKPVIQMTSLDRINNPFLNVLLDVTWAKGQFYRAYTLLLDPPGYQRVLDKPALTRTTSIEKSTQNKLSNPTTNRTSSFIASIYGPTKKTDDLWDIALKYKPQNASINQVMLGIIRLNPHAFMKGNINALKQNSMINIPSTEVILQVDRNLALREVNSHMNAWKNKTAVSHVSGFKSDIQAVEALAIAPKNQVEPLNDSLSEKKEHKISHDDSIKAEEINLEKISAPVPLLDEDKAKVETDSAPKETKLLDSEKITLVQKANVKKERLFDDFISIPPILKKIVKKPVGSVPRSINLPAELSMTLEKERNKTLNAEVAVAVSAIESVKESNQLLRQHIMGLTKQNELLARQLSVESKKDEVIRRKINMLMKVIEKDYVLSVEGNLIKRDSMPMAVNANEKSSSYLSILASILLLLGLGAGGFFAYFYLQQRTKNVSDLINEDLESMYGAEAESVEEASVEPINEAPKSYHEAVISTKKEDEKPPILKKTKAGILEKKVEEEQSQLNDINVKANEVAFITTNTDEQLDNKILSESLDNEVQEENKDLEPLEFEFSSQIFPDKVSETIEKEISMSEEKMVSPEKEDGLSLELTLIDESELEEAKTVAKRHSVETSEKSCINCSTQIALAETYIAMEDWQSAKESLETVIREGNKAQIEKASKLLSSLEK